jgi:hypothetical protein
MKSSFFPLNVAEMHVEDLAALAEPADHIEYLAGRVVEHLRDCISAPKEDPTY